jgi:hypothetical protein
LLLLKDNDSSAADTIEGIAYIYMQRTSEAEEIDHFIPL